MNKFEVRINSETLDREGRDPGSVSSCLQDMLDMEERDEDGFRVQEGKHLLIRLDLLDDVSVIPCCECLHAVEDQPLEHPTDAFDLAKHTMGVALKMVNGLGFDVAPSWSAGRTIEGVGGLLLRERKERL